MVSLGATYWRVHSMFHNTSESWDCDVNTTGSRRFMIIPCVHWPGGATLETCIQSFAGAWKYRIYQKFAYWTLFDAHLIYSLVIAHLVLWVFRQHPVAFSSSSVTATTQRNTTQHNWRQFRKIWDLQNMDLKCTQNETSMCEQEAWEDAKIMQNKAAPLQER